MILRTKTFDPHMFPSLSVSEQLGVCSFHCRDVRRFDSLPRSSEDYSLSKVVPKSRSCVLEIGTMTGEGQDCHRL